MSKKKQSKRVSESGVNEFINRLKNKGIDAGKEEAEKIVDNANKKAGKIVNDAEKQAEKLLSDAKKKIEKLEKSATESINIAFRDSVLNLENTISKTFVKQLKQMVKSEMSQEKSIRDLITAVIKATTNKKDLQILIVDHIGNNEKIDPAIYGITSSMLKEGIQLSKTYEKNKTGIMVKNAKTGIEIDMTDDAISELLLEHLLPRYQEILKGDK